VLAGPESCAIALKIGIAPELLGDFTTYVDLDALREEEIEELGGAGVSSKFKDFGSKVTCPAKGEER